MGKEESNPRLECYALLRQMRLFDDLMMRACFDDKDTVQYVLRIILDRGIIVKEVTVQKDSEPSQYHGVRFDVLAVDKDGRQCDIEIQQSDDRDLVKRSSFYSAVLERQSLITGEHYDDLRETYVIFITATDVFGRGLAMYHIERCFIETKEPFGDGAHIVFVNGAYKGDDDIGRLVNDMRQVDPDKMQSSVLANRMKIFKEIDEEGKPMSELSQKLIDILIEAVDTKKLQESMEKGMEKGMQKGIQKGKREGKREGKQEGKREGKQETARAMLADNMDVSLIARYTSLSLDEIEALKAGNARYARSDSEQ